MFPSIVHAVARIKQNVAEFLSASAIETACHEVGHRWRVRELGPAETIWAFLLQVLHGNTACAHVVRLARLSCSPAAYCDARARLPWAVYEHLLQQTSQAARRSFREPRWHGHRTFFADGTGFSMSDTRALRNHFGQPGGQSKGCGFPVAHLVAMFDAATGLLMKILVAPLRTHEMSQAIQLHPELQPGDVLVADRGFASYAHFALLLRRKLQGVFRVHQRHLVSFRHDRRLSGSLPRGTVAQQASSRLIRKLGRFDQFVEYPKPTSRPQWLSQEEYAAMPATLIVRELRYWTKTRGFRTRMITLGTTLLDPTKYPREDLAALYGRRWEIETNFAHLKTTMQMDVLHCRSVEGVLKELALFALVYNLARLVMLAASREQNVSHQRLSFVDALRWLASACEHEPVLVLQINPLRPHRYEPRVRKRRPKEFPVMKAPRRQLRKQLAVPKLTT